MTTTMVRQVSFKTGEVDIQNFKRTDMEEYLSAAQSLLNCEVATTGLARKRKGTQFLLDVSAYIDPNSQMYEFSDNQGNFYIVLSGNLVFNIFLITPGMPQTLTFYQTVTSPYPSANLLDLDYTLDNDTLIFSHPSFPPARLYVASYGPVVFAYQVLLITNYPSYDFGNINYSASAVNYTISGSTLTFVITSLAFTTAWIGGVIVGPGASPTDPLGYAQITNVQPGVPSGTQTTFTANIIVPFINPCNAFLGASYSIKQPAWSAALGWPSNVSYYQNRLWFGNTLFLPNTIFGSQINNPINFDVGVGRDIDAIVYSIGQTNSGPILWMNGGKQFEIYSTNYEFSCPQNENLGLTPATFSIRQQSSYGSSTNIKPTTYINDSYYINGIGKSILNFHFEGVGLAYSSSNISLQSTHLVNNPTSRALLRGSSTDQDNFIYYLNSDSSVFAFQFSHEYKLAALTPIEFQESVIVANLCSVNNRVYFIKNYSLTGYTFIEVFDETSRIDSYQSYATDALGNVIGLFPYNGLMVQVLLLGQDYGQYLVVNGTIQIQNITIPTTVTIGLLYNVTITPMYTFAGPLESNFYKNISRIFVDYYNSLNFYVNGTFVPYQTYYDVQNSLELVPKTGTAVVSPVRGWNRFDTFSITQSSPYDLQIVSIAYQVEGTII